MAEAIQQLVLDTLAKDGTVEDTRTLTLPGHSEPATTSDAQIILLGALNSLSSREVRALYVQRPAVVDLATLFRRCLHILLMKQ